MKNRVLFVLVSCLLAASMLAASCGTPSSEGSDFAKLFLTRLSEGDFLSAYSMIKPAKEISMDEFAELYTTAIGDGLDFTVSSVTSGVYLSSMKYSCTYNWGERGKIQSDYSMVVVRDNEGFLYVEWSPALVFPEMDWGDSIVTTTLKYKRGDIIADGAALATNVSPITVSADVSDMQPANESDENAVAAANGAKDALAAQIAAVLEIEVELVRKRLDTAVGGIAWIADYYPDKLSAQTQESLNGIDNCIVSENSYSTVRYYPYGSVLAHIVGYTGIYDDEEENDGSEAEGGDREESVDPTRARGRIGLEKLYNSELTGVDGETVFIRSGTGVNKRTLYNSPAQNGKDVQLTIDIDLQIRTEELLSNLLYGKHMAAAVIVMDPYTGAVKTMSSFPTFDLNMFASGISEDDYNKLLEEYDSPLFNRATQAKYPPGSTYKTITAAAALTYGVLDPGDEFDSRQIDDDYWTPTGYGTWVWPPIKRKSMRNRTEPLNMRNALLNSDNIYFANAALLLGDEKMQEFWNTLGLNEPVDFELGVASSQYAKEGEERDYKLLADSGYGQARILTSPLQLACAYCAFANGGTVPEPYIVDYLGMDSGNDYIISDRTEPRAHKTGCMSASVIDSIVDKLKDVVDRRLNGTGQYLRVNNCVIAGKTGTAEIGSDKSREISWFVGFRTGVSREDARLVLVVLELPTDKDYSSIKFDIARELLEMPTPQAEPSADASQTPEPSGSGQPED